MLIKITFSNLLHGNDFLCFGLMNYYCNEFENIFYTFINQIEEKSSQLVRNLSSCEKKAEVMGSKPVQD